nr:hypothetical protein [uncultured Porphyromonas sp.]
MKKFIPMLLLAVFALGVASCKKKNEIPTPPTPQPMALEGTTWEAKGVIGIENDANIQMKADFVKGGVMRLTVVRQPKATAAAVNTTIFEAKYTFNKPVLTLTGMKMTTQAGDPLLSDAAKKSIIEIFSKGGKLVDQRPLSLVFNEKANNPITLVKVEKK